MLLNTRTLSVAAAAAGLFWSAAAEAASDPTGIWLDQNGKGAVEISPCAGGAGFCGYVVNVKDPKNESRCGLQILGNVTSDGGGWIYSPDRGKKYSVELTRLSDDKLRVVGNAGHFFTKTFTWNRAPDDLARCGGGTAPARTEAMSTEPAKIETRTAAASSSPAAEPARADPVVLHGASSASVALLAMPRVEKRVVVPAAVTSETPPAQAAAPAPASKTSARSEAKKGASTPAAAAEDSSFEPERECKYRIPYINKVIKVPCRD